MTDAQLTALFDVIRNETATGGNTKGRVANAFQALADSMPWKGFWNWSANANAWPVSVKAGDIRATTDELAALSLPAGTILIAVIDGADSDVDYIKLFDPGVGGGSGTVTSVTSANADATVATATTTPLITIVNSPKVGGIAVTGTPSVGQVPTATSSIEATWQNPSGGSVISVTGSVVNNTDPTNPVINADAAGAAASVQTALLDSVPVGGDNLNKLYNLIVSVGQLVGGWNTSALPTNGTGASNSIDKGDYWRITGTITIAGIGDLKAGDMLIASVANASVAADFFAVQNNVDLATSSVLGVVKLYSNLAASNTDGAPDQSSVVAGLALKAPLASPGLTGVPTAPTAAVATNTTQIATTAFVLANAASTSDASETVKGIAELLDQTESETVATSATSGGADHTRVTSGRGVWWFWAKIKTIAQTVTAKWTFNDVALTNQIQASKKVGIYIDTDGTLKKIAESEYDSTNKNWIHTAVNDVGSSFSAMWQNSSLQLIMKILNDQSVEFGGSNAFWQVGSTVLSNNAGVIFNNNQAKAYVFKNVNGDEFIVAKTTTGDLSLRFRQKIEFDQGLGFTTFRVQAILVTSSTAATWNTILAIPVAADTAVSIEVSHLLAYAPDRSAVIASGSKQGLVKRDNANNTTGSFPTFTVLGASGSEGWRIVANDTTEAINIDFLNTTVTGKLWSVQLDVSYLVKLL